MTTHTHLITRPCSTSQHNHTPMPITLPGPPWTITDRSETAPVIPTIRRKVKRIPRRIEVCDVPVMDRVA